MPAWVKLTLALVGVMVGLIVLDRLGLWAEKRGWVYWRKIRPKGTIAAGLGAFQMYVEPQIQAIQDDHDERLAGDTDEEGAPPGKTKTPNPKTQTNASSPPGHRE
jgi:hypothetical protein